MKYLVLITMLVATVAQARDITVAWDDYSTDPTAVGINVYYAEHIPAEQRCSEWIVHNTALLPTTQTQYTMIGMDDAKSYCIEIRGIDADGVQSMPSNAVLFLQRMQAAGPENARLQ